MAAGAVSADSASLRQRLRRRYTDWVDRRIPPAREVTLNQKRLFIFPSRAGVFFALCLLVMLLTAINFQNNLSYALTFLLATLFILAILHTYANMSGLTIRAVRARPAFPGQQTEFELLLSKGGRRDHYAVHVRWPESSAALVNLVDESAVAIPLHMPVQKRGWFRPGRLLLETTYPLGLLRCWTWIDLDLHALVYPRPLPSAELPGLSTDTPDGAAAAVLGSDDFYGIRDYQRGDSLRDIHWKGLAKGHGLQSKQYTAYAERSVWLDWDMFAGFSVEQRLSHLCYWVLEFDGRGEEYGLKIPGVVIEPGLGERHREGVLRALALHGEQERSS